MIGSWSNQIIDESRCHVRDRHTLDTPNSDANYVALLLDLTAALCCCTKIENDRLQDHNRPLSWVGDTGIEPVTSSV